VGLKVYVSGQLVEKDEARISVFDRGLLYGDGVFEGLRAYGGTIFRCRQHVDRLFDSARAIALTIPLTEDKLTQAMYDTLEANGLSDAYLRVIVTRGVGSLGLDPFECRGPRLIIITDRIALYPPELYETGLEIITAATVRNAPNAVNPRIKSLNYLNNILAKIEGLQAGVIEAIMLNSHGMVAECTGDNIFIAAGGALATPPSHAGILAGITRDAVLGLARAAGIEARERDLTSFDLYAADECFLTGTAAELISVVKIDGRTIGDGKPGPLARRLLALLRAEAAGK